VLALLSKIIAAAADSLAVSRYAAAGDPRKTPRKHAAHQLLIGWKLPVHCVENM
jgi:hypothetical protein